MIPTKDGQFIETRFVTNAGYINFHTGDSEYEHIGIHGGPDNLIAAIHELVCICFS